MYLLIVRTLDDVRFEIQLRAACFLQGDQGPLAHEGGNLPYLPPSPATTMAKEGSGIPTDAAVCGL
eukprot:6497397-Pyramimonas_sp.AAC.1